MPSNGLLIAGGLGQGLLQGVNSYNESRRLALDEERQRRADRIQNAGLLLQANKEGYSFNPDTGEMTETPEGRQSRLADLMLKSAHANYYNKKANEPVIKPLDPVKVQRLADAFKKDMDPDVSRAGNFGQISQKAIQAQGLRRLALQADGSIANLPGPQQEEMAIGLARMLGGSAATDSRVHALVPKSAVGSYQDLKSWLLNEPQGRDQQAFTKYMMDTIERENDLANEQLDEIRRRRLPFHRAFKDADPEMYKAALHEYGLDVEPVRRNSAAGNITGAKPHPQDEQAVEWAKANPNDPRSRAILQANGVR